MNDLTSPAPRTLVVSATFTAEPIEPVLDFWSETLGQPAEVVFAPYNQVFQSLLDPGSELRRNRSGANLLLVRLADWGGDGEASDLTTVERNATEFVAALGASAASAPVAHVLCFCPCPPDASDEQRTTYAAIEQRLATDLASIDNVHVLPSAALHDRYPVERYADHHADEIGHVPYTTEMFVALGTQVMRKLSRLSRPAYKVIALDCDETLWGGVVGEDGAQGVRVDGSYAELQRRVLEQREAGLVLCLVSKNEASDVEAVFAQRDMPLRREHITIAKVNWERKSDNLAAIARELNVGADSILFLDDNPVEIAEVRARCPEVVALQVPRPGQGEDGDLAAWLDHLWLFDTSRATAIDSQRAQMYTESLARDRSRAAAPSLRDFLEGLQLQIDVADLDPDSVARAAQLTVRTNQFNFTTRRRDEGEVRALMESDSHVCRVVRVTDRFGDYGLVGLAVGEARPSDSELRVDTLLMSCRALGRGAEHALLASMANAAAERDLAHVRLEHRRTAKNLPAATFMRSVAAAALETDGDCMRARLPSDVLSKLQYDPDQGAEDDANATGDAAASTSVPAGAHVGELFARIAQDLRKPTDVANRVRPAVDVPVVDAGPYEAPEGDLEEGIADTWCDVLGVQQVGRTTDFFSIGGNSLIATRVISRLREDYEVELTLKQFFAEPTIAGLASTIEAMILEELEALDD